MINSVNNFFFKKNKYFKTRSFTYYIPSPPDRKTGYQEKEFDHVFNQLMEQGFDRLEYKMQAAASDKSSGMWIMCILGAKTQTAAELPLEIEYSQIFQNPNQHIKLDPIIEHEN